MVNPIDWYNDFFHDRLALYRVGAPSSQPIWYADVWVAKVTETLEAPMEPGDYEFRFLDYRQAFIAKSAVIRVTPRGANGK